MKKISLVRKLDQKREREKYMKNDCSNNFKILENRLTTSD